MCNAIVEFCFKLGEKGIFTLNYGSINLNPACPWLIIIIMIIIIIIIIIIIHKYFIPDK